MSRDLTWLCMVIRIHHVLYRIGASCTNCGVWRPTDGLCSRCLDLPYCKVWLVTQSTRHTGVRMPIYHLIQLNVRLSFCCMFVYISLYTCPFARLFVHMSHIGILSTVDTTQHIRNFYRTTHMHSADYAVVTCLSDRSSLCLSDSPSVYHTTGLPPCTGRKNTDIYGINYPYIMFTAMCPYVCLPLLYVPFVHFYDCLSICFYHLWACLNIASKTSKSIILHLLISFWLLLPLFRRLLHTDPKTMTVYLSVSLSFACLDMHTYSYASVTFTNNLSRRRLMVGAVV